MGWVYRKCKARQRVAVIQRPGSGRALVGSPMHNSSSAWHQGHCPNPQVKWLQSFKRKLEYFLAAKLQEQFNFRGSRRADSNLFTCAGVLIPAVGGRPLLLCSCDEWTTVVYTCPHQEASHRSGSLMHTRMHTMESPRK